MSQDVPRRVIQGVQALLFHDGPYVEVAERVRMVHKMGKAFRVHQVETFLIKKRWIYRASITMNDRQYIGDAEIHFGAPKETPDGTNPVSCGQTSAIGNALTFAGFGDLRLLLERLDQSAEAALQAYPSEAPHGVIEGVRVVWLDDTPYVPVVERLYHLHTLGYMLSMERCEVVEVNETSVYRVAVTVNDQRYVGDAEIHFDAPETTLDNRYPVSTAQTSAVGNALALAGFGDVRSILERLGKDTSAVEGKPVLASADAVLRANRLRANFQEREPSRTSTNPDHSSDTAPSSSDRTRDGVHVRHTGQQQAGMSSQQQDTIRGLCERLGETEPDYTQMTFEEARQFIEQLQASEEELFLVADEARNADGSASAARAAKSSSPPDSEVMSRDTVGSLKQAWLEAFHITGTLAQKRAKWLKFKTSTCGAEVDDTAMLSSQYDQLSAAIQQRKERVTVVQATKVPSGANG